MTKQWDEMIKVKEEKKEIDKIFKNWVVLSITYNDTLIFII